MLNYSDSLYVIVIIIINFITLTVYIVFCKTMVKVIGMIMTKKHEIININFSPDKLKNAIFYKICVVFKE